MCVLVPVCCTDDDDDDPGAGDGGEGEDDDEDDDEDDIASDSNDEQEMDKFNSELDKEEQVGSLAECPQQALSSVEKVWEC